MKVFAWPGVEKCVPMGRDAEILDRKPCPSPQCHSGERVPHLHPGHLPPVTLWLASCIQRGGEAPRAGDSRLQPGILLEGRGRRLLNGHCHRFPFTCSHSCFFLRFTDLLSVNPWNTLARGISGLTASRGIRGEVKLCVGPGQD